MTRIRSKRKETATAHTNLLMNMAAIDPFLSTPSLKQYFVAAE